MRGSRGGEHAAVGWTAPVLTIVPQIVDEEPRRFLSELREWVTRTRAQSAEPRHDMHLEEVCRRPSSSFSIAMLDIWDAVAPARARRRARQTQTVLVSSLSNGVGKTTIVANLARLAALEGARALIIEANASNPRLARLLEPESRPGLVDLGAVERPIYEIPGEGEGSLHLVPILPFERRIVRRLSGLASTRRYEGLSDQFNFVMIDGPSAEDIADLRPLATAADRIVVVVNPGEQSEIEGFLERTRVPKNKFAGAVLSKAGQGRANAWKTASSEPIISPRAPHGRRAAIAPR
ncbi:MAG TPA: cellulose synthase operon protein YhjQ/BcsQ [Beijerinckiaceae bacterium]|nr:cellulose synthase operon protein YhjQ/BcsQ [Beijerinckiaceae bacterium]